jgi:hypothetical protein
MKTDDRRWAHEEVDRQIDDLQARGDWNEEARLHISNPEYREHISRLIVDEIWPGIQRILEPTELTVDLCSDDGRPEILEERLAVDMSMSFLMLIQSGNGLFSDHAPFFCRMRLACSPRGFMVNIDFYVEFPESFEFEKLKSVMGHPKFAGNPPTLRYEIGHDGNPGKLSLCFEYGRGCAYGFSLPVDTMLADLAERVNFLRRLIRSVELLSQDYGSDTAFARVQKELVKCFEAW